MPAPYYTPGQPMYPGMSPFLYGPPRRRFTPPMGVASLYGAAGQTFDPMVSKGIQQGNMYGVPVSMAAQGPFNGDIGRNAEYIQKQQFQNSIHRQSTGQPDPVRGGFNYLTGRL